MKNLKQIMRITIAAMMLPSIAFSQIQDGGFENWDSVPFYNTGKNFLPKGWFETGNEVSYTDKSEWPVTRTNDAYKGKYAIQLKNVVNTLPQNAMLMTKSGSGENVNNKIPVTGKPTRLDCYYKFFLQSDDTFNVSVYLTKGEDIIGVGTAAKFIQRVDYTKLSVPIMYSPGSSSIMPDSAIILISLGSPTFMVEGTKLIIDEVAFGYSTGLAEQIPSLNADVKIWPNPASNQVNVSVSDADKQVTVELVNALGQTIQQQVEPVQNGKTNMMFDLTDLNSGIYFVKVTDHTGSKGFRLAHQ